MNSPNEQLPPANHPVNSQATGLLQNLKRVGITVGSALFLIFVFVGGWAWMDRRTDQTVREWMNGPRTDPLTYLSVGFPAAGGMREMVVSDSPALNYLSAALPTASRNVSVHPGTPVLLELRFKSGRVIQTDGRIGRDWLMIRPPGGEQSGVLEVVTLVFETDPPPTFAAVLAASKQ